LINVDGDDRHDLVEVGPENRGDDNVVGADLEDNVEADDDDLDEREAWNVDAPGPWKQRETTLELDREGYTSYLDVIEWRKSLENKMMTCMYKFLDMWIKVSEWVIDCLTPRVN